MQVIGHRGARAVEPENTLRAFYEGMRCADAVEVDLRRTCDGELVAIHDATLDRTTNGRGPVNELGLDELRRLDAGLGERIPTFHEVLALVRGHCNLVVEIKDPGTEDQAYTQIRDAGHPGVTIVSFHATVVERLAEYPGIRTGLIISGTGSDPAGDPLDTGADLLLPRFDLVTPEFLLRVHQAGLGLIAWTLNRDEEIRRMYQMGVDGIATDDPCHARKVIRSMGTPG